MFKFRFSSALADISQEVLLPTFYELFSIGINLDTDYIDHINRHYLQYFHIAIIFTLFKVILIGTLKLY